MCKYGIEMNDVEMYSQILRCRLQKKTIREIAESRNLFSDHESFIVVA